MRQPGVFDDVILRHGVEYPRYALAPVDRPGRQQGAQVVDAVAGFYHAASQHARQYAAFIADARGQAGLAQIEPAAGFAVEHQPHQGRGADAQHRARRGAGQIDVEQQVLAQCVLRQAQARVGRAAGQQQLARRQRVAVAVAARTGAVDQVQLVDGMRKRRAVGAQRQCGEAGQRRLPYCAYFACSARAASRYLAALGTLVHAGAAGSLAMSRRASAIMRFTWTILS